MKRPTLLYVVMAMLLLALGLFFWQRQRRIDIRYPAEPGGSILPRSTPHLMSSSSPIGRPPPVYPGLVGNGIPRRNVPETISEYAGMFMTPISFYGRVKDEQGNPVQGAQISFTAGNQLDPNISNPKYSATSNNDGSFSIWGLHGASLYVDVSKDGYYRTPPFDGHRGSYDGFTYAGVRSKDDVGPPTSGDPAVFVLRKRRNGVPLIHLGRSISVQKDGTPIVIDFQSNKHLRRDLMVECWTQDQTKDARGRFLWHCRVSVPGGGLVKREGEFDFEAPTGGYMPSDDIAPPQDRWSDAETRQYFIKTADDHYARVKLNAIAGGDHFVTIESYFNLTPGDRNLEDDPAKEATLR